MSLRIATCLAVLGTARAAAAERAIVVDAPDAPFAAAELAAEIRVRVAAAGGPVHVRVTATADGVRVDAPGGARDVALAGLRGEAAARLVALAADDLMTAERDAAPPALRASSDVRASAPATASLGVLGAVSSWGGALGGAALDLALPRGGWVLDVEASGGALVDSPLHLTAAAVRATAGLRAGPLEARIGAVAMPVFVSTGVGDATVLVGATASMRARVELARGIRGVLALGGDAFATRTEYRFAGMAPVSTPRFAPWVAAGVEVGL